MANQVNFRVGFTVDKAGLNEIKSSLQKVQQETSKASIAGTATKDLKEASQAAKQLEQILDSAWDGKLNQLNLSKVNNSIKTTFGSVEKLKKSFEGSGEAGAKAYNSFASSVLSTNLQLKQSNKLLDDMAKSMSNTVKWGITSGIFNNITNSIQKAWTYSKGLDKSLNDIRIVTGKSAEDMELFAKHANNAAKDLKASTRDYTDAALIYYQQGLGEEEVQARTEVTLKTANVTGQNGQEVSEQLTAIWNGYKVNANEAELYIDKVAAVAATTAADLEELSTGMGKVASAANSMGVGYDQLNAQLATIVSVTREAPETIGTSLRSIYARMGQLKSDGSDEFGVTLGRITEQLESMGIHILDEQGEMRDLGIVIEEVAEKWDNWSDAQKAAAAQAMAGTQQYSRLIALFDNWDMYTNALETSQNAVGTLNEQQQIYMDSTAAHLQQLSTEAERTYDILFDQDTVNGFSDALTGVLSIFNNFLDSLGGGMGVVSYFGTTAANIFNKQIGRAISTQLENLQKAKDNADQDKLKQDIIDNHAIKNEEVRGAGLEKEIGYAKQIREIQDQLTKEEYNQLTIKQQEVGLREEQINYLDEYKDIAEEILGSEYATRKEFEERLKYEKEELEIREEQLSKLDRELRLYQIIDKQDYSDDDTEFLYNRVQALKAVAASKKEFNVLDRAGNALAAKEELTEAQIATILRTQNYLKDQQEKTTMKVKQGLEGIVAAENGRTEQLKKQQILEEKNLNDTLNQKEYQQAISNTIQGMSALLNIGQSVVGILRIIGDESLSTQEKVSQIFSNLLVTIPMVVTQIGSITKLMPNLLVSFKVITMAQWEASVAAKGFGKALWEALLPVLPVILAVTAAIAAVTVAGYALVKAYNADADAAKEATENAQKLKQSYDDLKQSYDDLKTSIENYHNAQEALLKLTKGTEEWNSKVEELNNTVLELLDKYPELAEQVELVNGQLLIKDPDAFVKAQEAEIRSAQRASVSANQEAREANIKSNTTDLKRQINLEGELRGSAKQSFSLGTNSLIGFLVSSLDKQYQTLTDDEMKRIVDAVVQTNGAILGDREELKKLGFFSDDLVDSLIDNKDGLLELTNEIKANTAALKLENQQQIASQLESDERYMLMTEAQKGFVSSQISENIKENDITKTDEYKEQLKKYQDLNDKEMYQEYARILGYDASKVQDKNAKGIIYNTENEALEFSDAYVEDQLAREAAYKLIATSNKENNLKIAEALQKEGEGIGVGIADLLLGYQSGETDFAKLGASKEDVEKIQQAIAEGALDIPQEAIEQLGMLNAKEYTDSLLEGISVYLNTPESVELYKNSFEKFSKQAESAQGILDVLSKGTEADLEDEQLSALIQLEAEYEELGEIQDKTSHEYLETLREIKEQQETNAAEALKTTRSMQIDEVEKITQELENLQESGATELEITAKTEELESALEELEKTDHKIKVQIETDLATDVDDAFGLAEEFGKLTDLATEDLTLTFEEAQKLIEQGYGAVLQNAQETSEQTIKLNKETVNAYIDGKQSELEADKQAKIDQLEREKVLLQAQAKILEQKKLALEANTKEATAENKKQIISDALARQAEYDNAVLAMEAELKADNTKRQKMSENAESFYNDLAQQYIIDSENRQNADVAANTTSGKYANAVIERFRNMFKAANNFARAVANAITGNETTWEDVGDAGKELLTTITSKRVTGKYKGETSLGLNNSLDLIESANLSTEELDSVIEQMKKDTDAEMQALQNQIGAIDSGIAALKSASTSLDTAQGKAGTGSGGDRDTIDYLTEQYDIYHDINIEIEQISNNLDKLEKQQEKLFGSDLINNLNEQLKNLDSQIDNYNQKIKIAKGETSRLQLELAGKGVTFNADGTISNYAGAFTAQQNYVNSLIAQYNSMSKEAQEAYKDTVEQAQNDFETFVSNIESYDDLITSTIPELEANIQDAIDQQIEIQVEKFNMELELRLDMAEAERDWNDFKKTVIDSITDEDILGNAKAKLKDFFSYYKDDVTGVIQVNTQHVSDILAELKKMETGISDIYGDNQTQALEDLKTYYEQLMSDLRDVEDLQKEVHQSYLDMMDEAQEKFDEQVDLYEQVSDLIEHDMKVIELINGKDSYSELSKYYQEQENNYNKQLDFQKQQVEFWKQQMDSAEEGSEIWTMARDNWISAVDDWNSSIEHAIENLQDKYLNAINLIFDNLNNKITSGMGLEYINEQWNLINENADQYLDTINAMYGIKELESKYLDAIDQTDSISAQKQLNELMEQEVKALEEKDKLTQYDVERANMRYEIALKQIALQEAQQNKSQMRLKRDSQGNYSYQFVADDNSIAAAQDELSSLQNELYNFDLENYRDNLDQLYSAWEEFQEKMAEAAQINDPEERAERELLLQEQYGELINGLVEQNETIRLNLHESAFTELADLYNVDLSNFQNLTSEQKDIMLSEMIPQWTSGVQEMANVFAGEGGFTQTCEEAMRQLADATKEYENDLDELEQSADISFDTIANGEDLVIDQTQQLINDNNELINSYENQLLAVQQVISQLDTLISKYQLAKNEAIAATEAAYKYWQFQNGEAASANRGATKNSNVTSSNNVNSNLTTGGSSSNIINIGGSSNGSTGIGSGGVVSAGQEVTVKNTASTFATGENIWGAVKGNRYYVAQDGGNKILLRDPHGPNYTASGITGWVWKTDLEGFKTGGYTGDWGNSSGKLAMLHQKELVLNEQDTKNMLNAVSILRAVTGTIGESMLNRLASLNHRLQSPVSSISESQNTLEQNVHIQAEFPNVKNSTEIENAFNNLINIASQRVYKNNK